MGKGGPNYTALARCDPPHSSKDVAGCKSDAERVAAPDGPQVALGVGYSIENIALGDSGGESGPHSDRESQGTPPRRVSLAPSVSTLQEEDTADHSAPTSSFDTARATGTPTASLYLAKAVWLQQPAAIPKEATPQDNLRRGGSIIHMPRLRETGSGQGYCRHAPTTCVIRFCNSTLADVSSLVDTGASLSTIDVSLARRLGQTPHGDTLQVNGIGSEGTLGFVTLSFSIETTDAKGCPARLIFTHDFHVLPTFGPGVCLGQDWISGHKVSVDMGTQSATLHHHFPARKSAYNFPVRGERPPSRAFTAKVCSKRAVVLPPACHFWVDVDIAALVDEADYRLEPNFLTDTGHAQAVMAMPCVMDRSSHRILVTNFSDEPFELPGRTVLGQALAFGPGATRGNTTAAFPLAASGAQQAGVTSGDPYDPYEFDEQPQAASASAEATVEVDGVWRVGKDENGQPRPGVAELLRAHRDAFSLDGRPGHVIGPQMRIPVPDPSQLRAEAPRRVSPEKRAHIDQQLAQLLEWDVVEDSASPVSAPVLLVRQRDKFRFCVDYRSLNSATTPDRYPLPRIDDVLESLRGSSWFSSLDAIRGYHQTDIAPEDRWKTAFITHRGLLQYKRVPFGLRNAPAFFQRFMDSLLGPLRWVVALVYLDDVVVYTRSLSAHLRALQQLLGAAIAAGLRFSPAKCVFAVRELNLLGRKVSGSGLGVMEDRASALKDLPQPHTLRELYHTLGILSYYRQFIPRFAQVAAPLYDFLKGWSYRREGKVAKLVREDGSSVSPDKVVLQWEERHQKSLDDLKAALVSPPTLAHPDYNRPFLLYTDACKSGFAAAIHQIHVTPVESEAVVSVAWPDQAAPLDRSRWQELVRTDAIFGKIDRRLRTNTALPADAMYTHRDGILCRADDDRLCMPRAAILDILKSVHDDGGHFGYAKTYAKIARDFWHPRLSSLVEAYVRHCDVCLRTKTSRRTGALDIEHDATRPFQHISVDVILGLPRTRARHDAALVAVDTFSKMVLLEPCTSSFTAKDVTSFLLNRVVRLGWRPERLTSDHDLRIIGETGQQLSRFLGTQVTPTPPHHHRANPVERHIQTIGRVLRAMSVTEGGNWDEDMLPAVEVAMNGSISLATGMTPFDAIFIDSPRLLDTLLQNRGHAGVEEWGERFQRARHRLHEATTLMRAERERQQRHFDAHFKPLPTIQPGQLVWIRLRDRPIRAAPEGKLAAVKLGPFPVRRVLSAHRIIVDLPAHLNIDGEFDLSQVDLHPTDDDPFADQREEWSVRDRARRLPPTVEGNGSRRQDHDTTADPSATGPPRRGSRPRQPGPHLRDPMAVAYVARPEFGQPLFDSAPEAFVRPLQRSKITTLDGVPVKLTERPVAFMSRATTAMESRLAGPELELACIAWAFTRAQHLLEGAHVTVVTDHAPVPGMLSSRPGAVPYGQPIERIRAVLRPHLDNLHFVHKPGVLHTNVDALSRLVQRDRDVALLSGGHVTTKPTTAME